MKYAWIASHLELFELQPMCHMLKVNKSSYFSWTELEHLNKEQSLNTDYQLVETAFFYLKENAGTRLIKGYLMHEKNIRMSRRKIGKILAILDLKVKTHKQFEKSKVAAVNDPKIMPNILDRNFEVSYPNQAWVGDITEIKTRQGKLYLAAYIDLYSRRVWALQARRICALN